jgi:uncharacterized protein (DUF2147 family)
MKKIIATFVVIIIAAVFATLNLRAGDATPSGTWVTIADEGPDKGKAKSHIELFEKNGLFYGKISKLLLKPQDTLCDKCVGALKNKPLIGMVFVSDMKKTGKVDKDFGDEYAGGTIMDPDNGKTYKCKFWFKPDKLTVRGYIAFFYRTQKWYKLK